MAEPILNLILKDLTDAVKGVSAAGPAGQTLDGENREEPYNPAEHHKAVVRLGDVEIDEANSDTSGVSGFVQWRQHFTVFVKVVNSETTDPDAEPPDFSIVRAWSDTHAAVMVDRGRGTNGNGDRLAVDTDCAPPQWFPDGFTMDVVVDYVTRKEDPTRQD